MLNKKIRNRGFNMGDIINAKQVFSAKRGTSIRKSLSAIKQKNVMGTHRNALIKDITHALIIEIQRPVLGDEATDKFIDELQAYREFSAVCPNDFDDGDLVENIVYELTTRRGHFPTGAAFNKLQIQASQSQITTATRDVTYKKLLSEARNTSYGIMLLREWCQLDESQPVIALLKTFAANGNATAMVTQAAKDFIDSHIKISRSQISLSTEQAKANYKVRNKKHALESRCMAHNISLVND